MSARSPLTWIIATAGSASLALAVAAHHTPYFAVDLVVSRWVQSWDFGVLVYPMTALNILGFAPVVGLTYGAVIAVMLLARRRWEAAVCCVAVLGGAGLNYLAKMLVDRPRPSRHLIHIEHHLDSGSFPAGHVLNFTAFAGLLCALAWMNMRPSWARGALITTLCALMLLMGVARISAGEHWPSDVIGGYLLGVMWLGATLALYRWRRDRPGSPRPGL